MFAQPKDSVRLAGAVMDRYYHACAFFHGQEEAARVVHPFLHQGLAEGDKVVYIADPDRRASHLQRMAADGIDVAGTQAVGQFDLMTWDDAYLKDGQFSPDVMLDIMDAVIGASAAAGYPRTRIVGHMEWALADRPGVNLLLEYEARVTDVLAHHRSPAVCVYDLTRFSADVMVDVLRTHPWVIIGGVLRENPFFVPPQQFLQELIDRRTTSS